MYMYELNPKISYVYAVNIYIYIYLPTIISEGIKSGEFEIRTFIARLMSLNLATDAKWGVFKYI